MILSVTVNMTRCAHLTQTPPIPQRGRAPRRQRSSQLSPSHHSFSPRLQPRRGSPLCFPCCFSGTYLFRQFGYFPVWSLFREKKKGKISQVYFNEGSRDSKQTLTLIAARKRHRFIRSFFPRNQTYFSRLYFNKYFKRASNYVSCCLKRHYSIA